MAEFEERDLAESEPPRQKSSEIKDLAEGVGCLAAIGLAIGLCWFGWGYLKNSGWIGQTRITNVYMSGNWLTGEYRACKTPGNLASLVCPGAGKQPEALTQDPNAGCLVCDANKRSFSVAFHGKISGNPADTLNWQCKRETNSISCHAVQ